MIPLKYKKYISLGLTVVALNVNAQPLEQPNFQLIRTGDGKTDFQFDLSKDIYRQEPYQDKYTVSVPYDDTESYYEDVPYTVDVPYTDYEDYTDSEYQCHDETRYRQECRDFNTCDHRFDLQIVGLNLNSPMFAPGHSGPPTHSSPPPEHRAPPTPPPEHRAPPTPPSPPPEHRAPPTPPSPPPEHRAPPTPPSPPPEHRAPPTPPSPPPEHRAPPTPPSPPPEHRAPPTPPSPPPEHRTPPSDDDHRHPQFPPPDHRSPPSDGDRRQPPSDDHRSPPSDDRRPPTPNCEIRRECHDEPFTEQECGYVTVTKTRPVTRTRTETRYRQEPRTRTVTRYRDEERCCVTKNRDVFDHQITIHVSAKLPDVLLYDSEKEILDFTLTGNDANPIIQLAQENIIYGYKIIKQEISGANANIELGFDPRFNSLNAGADSITDFKIINEIGGTYLLFQDSIVIRHLHTKYKVVVKDQTGAIVSTAEARNIDFNAVKIPLDKPVSNLTNLKLEMSVNREGLMVKDYDLDFTINKNL